jgi:protoheme IX farnesyltransferase
MFSKEIDFSIIYLIAGVLLLASGSSALNQVQEAAYDAVMQRTNMRPIPTGKLSRKQGFYYSMLFIVSGAAILFLAFGAIPTLLGLFNVLWYNGIYTPMKRISAFAVVPGSLVGAVPAYIGWCAAGGAITHPSILYVGLFLFIWQVPHFWLLMFKYGEEYRQAGFKTITAAINPGTLPRVIFIWILCTSFSSLLVPYFLEKRDLIYFAAIIALNIAFISLFVNMAFKTEQPIHFKRSFIGINVYMVVFMLSLIAFHLI